MARFNDVLNQFGDAELPENFLSSLMEAYDEDISIPVAKVTQVEAERDSYANKVNELKIQNFDLIRSGNGGGNNVSSTDSGDNSNTGNDNAVVTIADLFE